MLLVGLFVCFAGPILAQTTIDTKFVGGPKDRNGGYEDPSKFVIASNGTMFVVCPNGIFESATQGVTWVRIDSTTTGDFCFAPDSTLYLAGNSGVFLSTNFGVNWTNLGAQLPNGPFYSIIALPDGAILASCPSGIFRSIDKGSDWDHVGQNKFPASGTGAYLTATLKGTIMARNGNTYYRSTDEGTTWLSSTPLTIQIWPISGDNILRPSDNGLERSTDDGISWQAVPGSPNGPPYDVAMDAAGNLFMFFGWQLYVSKDSGTTWAVDGTISGGGQQLAFATDHSLFFSQPSEGIWRTLKPLSGVSPAAALPELSITAIFGQFPNDISFTLPERSDNPLSLFDIRGELVKVLAFGTFDRGTHTVSLPSNIPGGAYFCVLRSPTGTSTIKLGLP
jgi:photosystem II stability/assembly factor-like uncharacterized protein